MKASVTNDFFKKYPKSPLKALKICVETGSLPENNVLGRIQKTKKMLKQIKTNKNYSLN